VSVTCVVFASTDSQAGVGLSPEGCLRDAVKNHDSLNIDSVSGLA